jgi:hypothetical protein
VTPSEVRILVEVAACFAGLAGIPELLRAFRKNIYLGIFYTLATLCVLTAAWLDIYDRLHHWSPAAAFYFFCCFGALFVIGIVRATPAGIIRKLAAAGWMRVVAWIRDACALSAPFWAVLESKLVSRRAAIVTSLFFAVIGAGVLFSGLERYRSNPPPLAPAGFDQPAHPAQPAGAGAGAITTTSHVAPEQPRTTPAQKPQMVSVSLPAQAAPPAETIAQIQGRMYRTLKANILSARISRGPYTRQRLADVYQTANKPKALSACMNWKESTASTPVFANWYFVIGDGACGPTNSAEARQCALNECIESELCSGAHETCTVVDINDRNVLELPPDWIARHRKQYTAQ